MDIPESTRIKHTIRFLKWIRHYHGWWQLICTPNIEHMDAQIMKKLIGRLAEESFYEIIFVLLMVHRNESFMEGLFEHALLDRFIGDWEKDKDKIIQGLMVFLE